MAKFLFANNAATTLAGPIASNSTTANLAAGTGALFPNPSSGQIFALTFTDAATGLLNEIVYVTARSADTVTILRGQEGTTARAWASNDNAQGLWTAGSAAVMVQEAELQVQPGNYAVATGTANALVITLTPAPSSLASIVGSPIRVLIGATNTGSATLQIAAVGTASIVNPTGAALGAGQLVSGHVVEMIYNGSAFDLVTDPTALLFSANTWASQQVFNALITAGQINATRVAATGLINAGTLSASGTVFGAAASITGAATVGGDITSGGALVAATGVQATAGNVTAASGAVVAQAGVQANTGNVTAVAGNVVGHTGVVADTGNVVASAGQVVGHTGVAADTGNVTASTGRLRALLGAYGSGDLNSAVILGDFAQNLTTNGSCRLPNGLLIQQGFAAGPASPNTGASWGFAQTFNALFAITLTPANNNSPTTSAWILTTALNGFTFSVNQSNIGVYFIAIGT